MLVLVHVYILHHWCLESQGVLIIPVPGAAYLHENAQAEPEQSEEDVAVGEGHSNPNDQVDIECGQQGHLAAETVREGPKQQTSDHHSTEVDGGWQVLQELLAADQVKL